MNKPQTAKEKLVADKIKATLKGGDAVDVELKTSERVLSRITDGIYREPASALRELISNAYDADATSVIISTDAPRFSEFSVKDNGIGMSPEVVAHLLHNIGGSAKRTSEGPKLHVTSANSEYSDKGRKLIGKMGIGLFAIAQFTRHFLLITKCKGDSFSTIADVTLGGDFGDNVKGDSDRVFKSGDAKIWTEKASNINAHGTEVRLLSLLPRTKAELCSSDRWLRIDLAKNENEDSGTVEPTFHIGRTDPKDSDDILLQPSLPWNSTDSPEQKFSKFHTAIIKLAKATNDAVDLDIKLDNYLHTIWTLSLAAPLNYLNGHPFDLPSSAKLDCFSLENTPRGQATPINLRKGQSIRQSKELSDPKTVKNDKFNVLIDGIQLSRPITFTEQVLTTNAVKKSLIFIGKCREDFTGKPISMSRGPLEFEAYLFWTPKVVPKQHQGVMIRIGNASGALFDRTFMNYQVSEQTRLRQIVAEIYVHQGLDNALNLDRESFNFSHPHYQYLVKWLHSAIRQLSNRHKNIGSEIRDAKKRETAVHVKKSLEKAVAKKLRNIGVEDVAEVIFLDKNVDSLETENLRDQGSIVFQNHQLFATSPNDSNRTVAYSELHQQKATALTQLLYGWGLLDDMSYDDQARLIRDILEITLMQGNT